MSSKNYQNRGTWIGWMLKDAGVETMGNPFSLLEDKDTVIWVGYKQLP